MTALILRALWKPLAALLALLGIYAKGRADARAKAEAIENEANRKTRERMDDEEARIHGDDPAASKRWLRERGQSDGDL